MQSVGGVHTAYVLSSVHLAHTARLPAFDSDLSRSFFIGVQSTSGQPLIVSPPAGSAAQVIVSLRWCTTADAFPTTAPPPHTVEHINTTVALAGYQASTAAGGDSGDSGGGGGVTFSDQGSWIYRDDDRTLVEYKWKEEGRRRREGGGDGRGKRGGEERGHVASSGWCWCPSLTCDASSVVVCSAMPLSFPSPVPFTPAGALSSCQTLPRSRTGLSTSPSSCLWICPRPQRPGEHGDHGGVVGVGVYV